jgi:NADPH:quinone reductase-like Zn-dependent oxidoreductase
VVEAGGQVGKLKPGDRVLVNPRLSCQQCPACLAGRDDLCPRSRFMGSAIDGSYAEMVAVPAANAHVIDDGVSYQEAAAVPTTFLPVWNMLIRRMRLQPWETVLVLSASAGVGTAAIQVAKKVIGARVIATTSTPEKAAKALELGADAVINYNEEDITERARALTGGAGVDVVVDHVGADFFSKAFSSLRPGGRYGICGATTGVRTELHLGMLFSQQKEIHGVFMGSKEDMREIVALLNRGAIRPAIDRSFPLAEAAEAHRVMEGTSFFGKLLLTP